MAANADDLARSLTSWLSTIASKLGPDAGAALSVGLLIPGSEVSVTTNLRAGVILLEVHHAGRRLELHREAIPPLRLGLPISVPVRQ